MRIWTGLCLVGLASGLYPASAQERLPQECRQEIRRLCGGAGREGLRDCIRSRAVELSESCRSALIERIAGRAQGAGEAARSSSAQVVAYGQHGRQAVDYYPAAAAAERRPPLVLFVHGGGWAFGNRLQTVHHKPAWFTANGYAFASAGYRVLPDAPVEDQARDVAAAVRAMRSQAGRLGFDPDRIVLMGHSAGAHLAALVATDPRYAGADFAAIKGVILLDGAGYDVAANMAANDGEAGRLYRNAFGTDPDRQRALSPVTHAGAPNAPAWLILHVAERAASTQQSRLLGEQLLAAGASVDLVGVSNTDHGRLNRDLGAPGDVATAEVARFLERLF